MISLLSSLGGPGILDIRSSVGVVYRSGANGFHHIIDACDLQQCTFFIGGRRSRRPFLIPLVPGNVLVGGRVRDWRTNGSQCRLFCALQT